MNFTTINFFLACFLFIVAAPTIYFVFGANLESFLLITFSIVPVIIAGILETRHQTRL